MRSHSDVKTDDKFEYSFINNYISLNKLLGHSIKDVLVRLGSDYSETDIMIKYLVMDDGTTLDLQGEHDEVYLDLYRHQYKIEEEELQNIYDTDPDNQ